MASQAVSLDNRQHRTYSPTFYFDHAVAGEDRGSGATEPNRVLCTRFTDKVWGPFLKQQQSGVNDVTPWVVLNDTVDGVPAAETEAFKTDAVNAAKKFLNLVRMGDPSAARAVHRSTRQRAKCRACDAPGSGLSAVQRLSFGASR